MSILYDTSLYTHRNEVYGIARSNVTVLFSELQNSSCHGLTLELHYPRILCSYPPTRFKYMGGKRRCERRGSVRMAYATASEASAASRSDGLWLESVLGRVGVVSVWSVCAPALSTM